MSGLSRSSTTDEMNFAGLGRAEISAAIIPELAKVAQNYGQAFNMAASADMDAGYDPEPV